MSIIYNRLGQVTQQTAQTGTVRQFLYDKLGRLTDDKKVVKKALF